MQGKLCGTEPQGPGFLLAVESTVAVQVIPEHRVAQRGKMRADLMRTAGDQMHPEAGNGAGFQCFIAGDDRARA